ncbi:hypothetical protein [Streptomyces sp. NBC_01803]|uniref:hypothetical protein n=1 Tax=Streptomyces sp. NBC_01803 TaxID=2975946 RepID=UPI003FA375BE
MTGTLRALEEMLLRRGRRTAVRNAWAGVQEDRARAELRAEAERALLAVTERGARPTAVPSSGSARP